MSSGVGGVSEYIIYNSLALSLVRLAWPEREQPPGRYSHIEIESRRTPRFCFLKRNLEHRSISKTPRLTASSGQVVERTVTPHPAAGPVTRVTARAINWVLTTIVLALAGVYCLPVITSRHSNEVITQ